MSITSRINEMSSHIEQAYDELQGLGADLTNVDKNIENISMVLDDIYDSMPQVSGEGTSLTLDDTRVGKIKSTLKGNTSQTTYSGYNLCEFSSNQNSKVTVNNDGTIRINGTSVGFSINYNSITFESGTAYSCIYQLVSGSVNAPNGLGIMSAFGTSGYWPGSGVKETVTPSSNLTRQGMWVAEGAVFTNAVFKVLIYKGSDTKTWEPYVGSTPTNITPSPNPSYPQPVNVVSGDSEINVCGKNLLPNNATTQTINGVTFTVNDDKSVTLNGTASAIADFYMYGSATDNGEYYCIPKGTYSISDPSSGWFYIGREKTLGAVVGNSALLNALSSQDCYFYGFIIRATSGSSFSNLTLYPQIEKGSSASTYEPYQGNTYNIDLPEGMELCKIGNYQDYFYKDNGKWYLHKEIGKVVLNGSENWQSVSSVVSGTSRFYYDDDNILNPAYINAPFSNMFKSLRWVDIYNQDTTTRNGVACWDDDSHQGRLLIRIDNTFADTVSAFKTWLGTNLPIVYYVLATPTNEEITYQPLIDQLNELEKAMSKDGQTNISQVNNDLPFKITASALKEWSV